MLKITYLPAALLFFFVTGCSLMPDYIRPGAPVPPAWPEGPAYEKSRSFDGASAAMELAWREFFTDPRLQTLIETALQNNRDLRVAALNVERARAYYRIQRAERWPAVDVGGSGFRERVPADLSSSGASRVSSRYDVELATSAWEIDFFGRIRSLEARAMEEYLSTEQARRGSRILLISEIASAYLTLAADRENLALARSTLEAQQASYDLIRRRFEVGVAPKLDLRQVQTRVEVARLDVARYTGLAAQDENALTLLVGGPVPADLLPDTLSEVAPLPEVSPGTPSEALLQRPDILQAESALKAAYADIGAARATLFPRIVLTGAVGTASAELSGLFDAGSGAWSFAPRIAMPIFDPRAWGALEVTKVQREMALARYEGAIQAAFREVADVLAQKGTLGDQLAAQRSLVEATAETYQLANSRYEKGSDTFLSVLDAQRSLYAAQQGLIAIRLVELANQVRLYAVLGGGGV